MDIKKIIEEKKLRQWEIAEIIGISEFTLSRWLRRPDQLSQDQRTKIEAAIEKLLQKGGE